MANGNVAFLNAGGVPARNDKWDFDAPSKEATVPAGETNGFQALKGGLFHGGKHVR
jgi:hypothetical protein